MRYHYKKQWRAVGACEYDVFHRDTLAAVGDDIVGTPGEVWAVIDAQRDHVVADCYSAEDAKGVRDALNKGGA